MTKDQLLRGRWAFLGLAIGGGVTLYTMQRYAAPKKNGPHLIRLTPSSFDQYTVETQVDGRKYSLIFDTGCSSVVLRDTTAYSSSIQPDLHKNQIRISNLNVSLGTFSRTVETIFIQNMPSTVKDGLLGNLAFAPSEDGKVMGKRITLRFYKDSLEINDDPSRPRYKPEINALRLEVRPIKIEYGAPDISYVTEIKVDDHRSVSAIVDTGAHGDLTLPDSFQNYNPKWIVAPDQIPSHVIPIKNPAILHLSDRSFPINVSLEKTIRRPVIGARFLKQFKVTWDFRDNEMYLEKPD